MSRITPSVVTKLCHPHTLLLPPCLQSLSASIVLKVSRELLEFFLQPYLIFIIFLLCPSKLVHFISKWFRTLSPFLLCIVDVSSSTYFIAVTFYVLIHVLSRHFLFYFEILTVSCRFLTIAGITWALESSVGCSNRLTTFPLPWLRIINDVTSRNHSSIRASTEECVKNQCFPRITLIRNPLDAKKHTIGPEVLLLAATSAAAVLKLNKKAWTNKSLHRVSVFSHHVESP